VKDTAAGFAAIARCDNALGRVVNIGRGHDVSIGDLVDLIGRCLGRSIAVETDSQRIRPAASEVERLIAGTSLAQSLWGWKPEYSLEQGLDETIAWVRDNLHRFRVDAYAT
jgi:dTDP-glucose 4,6-dehydratase